MKQSATARSFFQSGWTATGGDALYHGGQKTVIGGFGDQHALTAPVGSYRPNEFGFYDLDGNVCEWSESSMGIKGTQWTARLKAVRGASFVDANRQNFLLSNRRGRTNDDRAPFIGFRCVLVQ